MVKDCGPAPKREIVFSDEHLARIKREWESKYSNMNGLIVTMPPVIHPSKLQRAQQYAAQVRERNPQMQVRRIESTNTEAEAAFKNLIPLPDFITKRHN